MLKLIKNKYKNTCKYSLKLAQRALVVLVLFLITPGVIFANIDLNKRIQETESALNQTQLERKTLTQEVASFDTRIVSIQSKINGTYVELNKNKQKIALKKTQIKTTEEKIINEKEKLTELIKASYLEGQTSTLEVIVKSTSFTEFVNRSEYLESIQLKIKESADKMVELRDILKKEEELLLNERKRSEQLLRDQTLQKQAIDSQRYAKNLLLQQTRGNERAFQNLLKSLYDERARLSVNLGEGSFGGGTGGYPYSNANPSGVDPWGFYFRQCTSYAAWRSVNFGPVPASVLTAWGTRETANGGDWARLGKKYGRNVSSTPTQGSIMAFPYGSVPGGYGHVAIVDSVNPNGTVNISEYNYARPLAFGRRTGVNPWNYGAVFIR